MSLRLGQLRAFIAVAREGGVTRAARVVYRTQSALTRAIRELERDLGVALFERRPQGMLLTEFGEALLCRAQRAEREFELFFSRRMHERHLAAFIALAESHHMPTVAQRLGVTQPAVSASIRALEASLGVALFQRTAKGMLPTAHGEALAMRVKRAFAEIRIARAEISALQGLAIGDVTVGASPLGRALILPRAIGRLLPRHPGLRVATVEGSFDAMATGLRSGDIDFVFGALHPERFGADFAGEPLFTDEFAVIARAGHPLAGTPTFAAIARARWVLPHRGTPTRRLVEQVFTCRGIAPPHTVVETSDLEILRGMLRESDLLTAASPQQFDHELRTGALVRLPIPLPETSRIVGITQRADGHPSPAATLLMEEVRAFCREFVASMPDHGNGGRRRAPMPAP